MLAGTSPSSRSFPFEEQGRSTTVKRTTDADRGASAVEYALLVGAITAVIVVVVFALGGIVQQLFSDTCQRIDNEVTQTASGC